MSVFDTLPEFDHTLDDRTLEIGILVEQYQFDEVQLETPVTKLVFGWFSFDESEESVMSINVSTYQVRLLVHGHSVYEGDYTNLQVEEYSSFEELLTEIRLELNEYFDVPVDTETDMFNAVVYDI